uniref:p10.6 kDa protein n=1 Tax=Isavirus salaris TaxID=55987 RepID=C1I1V7_9ORTO|nr:p10.6 kDa protein [Infectious salmon anemia virus]
MDFTKVYGVLVDQLKLHGKGKVAGAKHNEMVWDDQEKQLHGQIHWKFCSLYTSDDLVVWKFVQEKPSQNGLPHLPRRVQVQ